MQFDAYSVATLAVACFDIVLGAIVLAQDFRSRTNIAYAFFALTVACWGFGVAFYLASADLRTLDFLARFLYFAGGSIPASFLFFSIEFLAKDRPSRFMGFLALFPTALFMPLYFFTNLLIAGPLVAFDGTHSFSYGPLHYLFDLHLWGYFAIALALLIWKCSVESDTRYREHILFVTLGTFSVLAIAGATNVVAPLMGIFDLIWVGPTSTIMWVCVVAYAVLRHQLFDIRIIATELFVIVIWLLLTARIFFSTTSAEFVVNLIFFGAFVAVGVVLIRSVIKEVRQREKIEQLAGELEAANRRQEGLIHFISHEVKGALGKCASMLSLIREGDFGPVPEKLSEVAGHGLSDTRTAVDMVSTILLSSNLKSGKMHFNVQPLDLLEDVVRPVYESLKEDAARKGLRLTLKEDTPARCRIKGDRDMLAQHIVRNLIDNAIKYTPRGDVVISVRCASDKALLSVTDSGIGITPADMEHLFTEGGRGRDSIKVNVNSTGYGLYFAKQLVTAHAGSIRAESPGEGKGSTFIVELPLSDTIK